MRSNIRDLLSCNPLLWIVSRGVEKIGRRRRWGGRYWSYSGEYGWGAYPFGEKEEKGNECTQDNKRKIPHGEPPEGSFAMRHMWP